MNILYIDANIFLGFYHSNRPEFKKLLNSIIELKERIFFTEQFKNEIDRNKLNVFKQSIDNYIKQVLVTNTILPEHLDKDSSSKLTSWNDSRKRIEKQIQNSNNELIQILNETLKNVSSSEDNVSKTLSTIYRTSKKPTIDDLNKARFRKEIGNPPGKKNDTLGDQLSWEMLLKIVPDTERIWIVTKDQDYYTESKDALYLNPVLHNDLIQLNPNIEIKIFNKLSEALRDFNNQELIVSIPNNNDLDIISVSESYPEPLVWQFGNKKEIEEVDEIDLEILNLLSNGFIMYEIKDILLNKGFTTYSLSFIEKRISKLKDMLKANNTIHLISIAKNLGII